MHLARAVERLRRSLPPPPARESTDALELMRQVNVLGNRIERERDPERKAALRAEFRALRERALEAKESAEGMHAPDLREALTEEGLRIAAALGEERGLAAVFIGEQPAGEETEDLTGEIARRLYERSATR